MISDYIFLYQLIRAMSILLSLLIAVVVLRKQRNYLLNRLISLSFFLFSLGFLADILTSLFSNVLQANTSYLMACMVLIVTTAIYIIFLVSYALMKGEEQLKDVKFVITVYLPFFILWLIALFTNSFNFKIYAESSGSYWFFEPNPIGALTVMVPAIIYLILADYYLLKLYRLSPSDVKPMLRQFTFGVSFAVIFGVAIFLSAMVLSQTIEMQYIIQTFRPVGIVIGGIFIAMSFLKNSN